MPIYEYQCLACGHRHEQIQRLDDPPLAVCPDCGGALKKLVSSPAFQFKGTGWYVTDYAAKKGAGADGTKSSGRGDGAEPGSASQGSEKSSESGTAKSAEATASSDSKSTETAKTPVKKESPKAADS